MSRQCQPCTACCQGWLQGNIRGFKLKPGNSCPHLTGTGCGIHQNRPVNPCQTFFCAWVKEGSPLPEKFRPDQCGVIIRLNHKWRDKRVHFAIPVKEKVPEDVLRFLIDYAQKTAIPLVWVTNEFRGGKFVKHHGHGYGPPDFVKAVQKYLETHKGLRF